MAAKLHRGIETRQWTFYRCVGRIQVRVVLMRHRYATTSDRWVLQPSIIYDCASEDQ